MLPKYLTKEVYEELKDQRTSRGVNLEDIIRAGVTLPGGARPPRGVGGVYAGDAESYKIFAPLLMPLILDYHKVPTRRYWTQAVTSRLQRHQSNLNPQMLLERRLDPEGNYILYTRMRLARSLMGFAFPSCISRADRRKVEILVKDCVEDWKVKNPKGYYKSVMEMQNSEHSDLIQRRLLFQDPDAFATTSGFGRDWPDARGIYCNTWEETPSIMIWCNAEDHIWIISNAKGGDVQAVFTELSRAAMALETSLKERNHAFIEDSRLGFLNSSPANIGTAFRASVYVKLVRLSRQPGFFELLGRLRLEARTEYSQTDKRFTGIYDIANAQALGKSEVDLINIMIRGVGILIDLEKRLERKEAVDLSNIEV
jgi:creatine kinase